MCATCVATGGAYVVPALAGLKLYGSRLRRRRLAAETPAPPAGPTANPTGTRTGTRA